MEGHKLFKTPKPIDIPVFKPSDDSKDPLDGQGKTRKIELPPENLKKSEPDFPKEAGSRNTQKNKAPKENDKSSAKESDIPDLDMEEYPVNIEVNYYGSRKNFPLPQNYRVEIEEPFTNAKIAEFWKEAGSKDFGGVIAELTDQRGNMKLNDWGYFLLVKNMADQIYPESINKKHLLMWYLLVKSGYKTRVGLVEKQVYLFIPAVNNIYEVPFIRTSNSDHPQYILNFDDIWGTQLIGKKISTYDGDYPGTEKYLDMNLYDFPAIENKIAEKKLHFTYQGKSYSVPVKYNNASVEFYKYYPHTEFGVYFNAAVCNESKTSLIKSLKVVIDGKPEPVAANIILRFVQTAFEYKTDEPNFGREKPLFVEETLHYNFSDCEDRAVLYSFLIKNLLGLKVVGVKYPGHVATAVNFNVDVKGEYLEMEGERYTICDPTYINAYIGMAMPEFSGKPPEEVIILEEN
jgi:hypothetical protein